MPRLYTKTGDSGTTALGSGERVSKSSLRIEAYGTVDELNSCLGMILTYPLHKDISHVLMKVQNDLFDLGADLSCPRGKDYKFYVPRITLELIEYLENRIDHFTTFVSPFTHFVLPGGSAGAAFIHFARTICRRSERHVVALHTQEEGAEYAIRYLNRLSDLLFIMARFQNLKDDQPETPWVAKK